MAPTLILVKNCRKQARGSTLRLLASSRMNCMTMVWWATCSISACFCGGVGGEKRVVRTPPKDSASSGTGALLRWGRG